jgi:hypothetical protein
MQPQQPSPAPPPITPSGHQPGQYDFLFQPPPKKSRLSLNLNSTKQRILVVVGGGVLLLFSMVLVFSLLSGAGSGNKEELLGVAQRQSELIRIATIGTQKARSTTAKNLAVTTYLSLTSDQKTLTSAMSPKPSTKQLALGKNAETDQLLTAAEQNNKFDEVFITEIQQELIAYQQSVKKAYDNASGNKLKQILAAEYKNASVLAGVKEE